MTCHSPQDRVSIIIPTYNREDFIEEAIQSVLNQTHTNFELIIVDDGSTDATGEIVKKYISSHCRYYLLSHSGNISRTRNFGLQHATGEYIAYLDADDLWSSEKLHKQITLLKSNPDKSLAFTDVIEFRDNKVIRDGIYKTTDINGDITFKKVLRNKLPVYPSSIIYRKSGLQKVGLHDEAFPWNDLGFITRFIATHGAVMCKEKLTRIRKHNQNISTVRRNEAVGFRDMIQTTEILYRQNHLSHREFANITSRFYSDMGTMLSRLGEYKNAMQACVKALSFTPLDLKTRVRYMLLLLKSLSAK